MKLRLVWIVCGLLLAGCSAGPAASPTPAATSPAAATQPAAPASPTADSSPTPPAPTASPTAAPEPTQPPTAIASVDPAAYTLMPVVDGLTEPVFLAAADDSGRLYVVEQPGVIRMIVDGELRPEPFLDLTVPVSDRANEQGLLGLAFHPRFADNGWLYVNYTDGAGDTVVARYTADAGRLSADPASAQIILQVDQPFGNHNGGHLAFGPDGYLYIGLGDGGAAGDPGNRAQSTATLLGKLLRLDVDSGTPYAIPPDNPFAGQGGALGEIWATGLRNPWRFSFDRLTGDLYIGDVGQNAVEEISFQPAASAGGENYGWRIREGTRGYTNEPAPPGTTLVPPVAEYTHAEGGCSVTGGYVYRGAALPGLHGVYLFGDYCSGLIWSLQRGGDGAWDRQLFLRTGLTISSFGESWPGELYVLDHRGGAVYRLSAASP